MSIEWRYGECLITGGAGYLGRHLIAAILSRYESVGVKAIVRSESDAAQMCTLYGKRVLPVIGDIRDVDMMHYLLQDVDTVIHLAAMKHIDLCETNVTEAVDTNVLATMNLLHLFDGDTFISMSTDKVAGAAGCYGATKLLLERLTLERARRNPDRRYMVVRSGNIFGSSGSVIQKWVQQIKQENKITVTDLSMTRFFIDANTLAQFILGVLEDGKNGKIYIPEQEAFSLGDLAKAVIAVHGNKDTRMEIIGRRDGEKMHERLFFASEKNIVVAASQTALSDGACPIQLIADTSKIEMWLNEYVK